MTTYEDLTRKGFGGACRDEDIDLTPTIVQTISRILKNRHPNSVNVMACLNSLFLWTNHVAGNVFHFFNLLGDCYRYLENQCSASTETTHDKATLSQSPKSDPELNSKVRS